MSCNESKHRYLTEIISFIGERVPSETDKTYAFSRYHAYLNSPWVFLYNLTRFNALTRNSLGCWYDIVVPLIEMIKGWNKRVKCSLETTDDLSCTKLGVIPKDAHRSNNVRRHAYDSIGFYHKEKHSMLECDFVWNVSLTWYAVDTNA